VKRSLRIAADVRCVHRNVDLMTHEDPWERDQQQQQHHHHLLGCGIMKDKTAVCPWLI
jgi:hypothetical protein